MTAAAVARLDHFLPITKITPRIRKEIESSELTAPSRDPTSSHQLTFENVRKSSLEGIQLILKPVSFYNRKAEYLKRIADQIDDVPCSVKELCALPGIGIKMATIIMDVCFDQCVGLAVDTHVCRIA